MRRRRKTPLLVCALVVALLGVPCGAAAQPAAGVMYDAGNTLVTFDTDTPGTLTGQQPISGLRPAERIEAIDFRDRPAPSASSSAQGLYALAVTAGATDTLQLYRIDIPTGRATPVGGPISGQPSSSSWDADFDAGTDQLRAISDAGANLRIAPDTGALAGTDPSIQMGCKIGAFAYAEGVPERLTTLHAFELTSHELVTIDGATGVCAIYSTTEVAPGSGVRVGYDYTPYDSANPAAQVGFITLGTAVGTGELYRIGALYSPTTLEPVGALGASLRAFALLPTGTGPTHTTPPPPPPPSPTPGLRLSRLPHRITLAQLLRHGVRVAATPTTPLHALEVSLVGTARSASISRAGDLVLASRAHRATFDRPLSMTLKPPRRLIGRPRHTVILRIRAVATDAAGKQVAVSATLRVTVARVR
ncbi:MAG TPA: DUF4394 domain-containing protein [Conexibacter sp.]|nr:DUF4394 domain-containing protein [Conexibacter sp.]